MKPIPYGRQSITHKDIEAVVETLNSDFLTQGPKIKEFEILFAEYIGSKYAIAVSNGTAALHLSALALDIKHGDKIITTPITFAASANCIRYCGGEVVFVDINSESKLIDLEKVKSLLKSSPPNTFKGIIPVDFAGYPVNTEELRKIALDYNLWILEDACHSPGGYFEDSNRKIQNCGNGIYADLSIFSFHPVKHIATGEGGMITTNDEKLYKKILKLRTHGITNLQGEFINSIITATGGVVSDSYPGWYMEMQDLGFNYRITDFQAALGISQLERADQNLIRRNEIAKRYYDAFQAKKYIKKINRVIPGHAYHLYIIEVEDRLGLYNYLRENKILAQIHYFPTHLMPYYQKFGWKYGDMPEAEKYYANCLSLPMFPTLTEEEQEYVIDKINSYYE